MLARLAARGVTPTLRLVLGARETGRVVDANVIGELRGRDKPDEIVLIGAHLDSWDLSCGAHDDGAGVAIVIEAARLLKELNLVPRRTIRVVLFANEERGLDGGTAYAAAHAGELARHVAAFETDSGGFRPTGFSYEGRPEAADRLDVLMPLFRTLGDLVVKRGGSGADIGPAVKAGVPGLGFSVDGKHYFDYHHSELDTPDKVDPADLKDAVAAYALMTWLLAEMPEALPR
jgi:Zn-dependent M28 family amino/carboxypeptidase